MTQIWYWGVINYNAQWVNVNIRLKSFPKKNPFVEMIASPHYSVKETVCILICNSIVKLKIVNLVEPVFF